MAHRQAWGKAVSTAVPAREAILSGEAFQITKTVIPVYRL